MSILEALRVGIDKLLLTLIGALLLIIFVYLD